MNSHWNLKIYSNFTLKKNKIYTVYAHWTLDSANWPFFHKVWQPSKDEGLWDFNIGKSVCLWCVNSGIFYRCWPCIEPTFSQCPCFYDTGMRRLPSLQLQRKRVSIIPIAWWEIKIYQLSLCTYVYVIFALNRQKKSLHMKTATQISRGMLTIFTDTTYIETTEEIR